MLIARDSTGKEGAILIHPDGTLVADSGVVPTSVWSAADAAAGSMTLSNGGLTVAPQVNTWDSIRGTISRSSGKYYFEVAVNVTATTQDMAVGLANAIFTANSLLGLVPSSAGAYFLGSQYGSGFTMNYSFPSLSPAVGDVASVAVDFNAGMFWLAYNNVWQGTGNPATGTTPAGTFSEGTVGPLFPAMTFGGGTTDGVWTLQPTAASQKYAPPAGFSAWG